MTGPTCINKGMKIVVASTVYIRIILFVTYHIELILFSVTWFEHSIEKLNSANKARTLQLRIGTLCLYYAV